MCPRLSVLGCGWTPVTALLPRVFVPRVRCHGFVGSPAVGGVVVGVCWWRPFSQPASHLWLTSGLPLFTSVYLCLPLFSSAFRSLSLSLSLPPCLPVSLAPAPLSVAMSSPLSSTLSSTPSSARSRSPVPVFEVRHRDSDQVHVVVRRFGERVCDVAYTRADGLLRVYLDLLDVSTVVCTGRHVRVPVPGFDSDEFPLWLSWSESRRQLEVSFVEPGADSGLSGFAKRAERALQLQMGASTYPSPEMLASLWVWYVSPVRRRWLSEQSVQSRHLKHQVFSGESSTVLYLNRLNRVHVASGCLTFSLATREYWGTVRVLFSREGSEGPEGPKSYVISSIEGDLVLSPSSAHDLADISSNQLEYPKICAYDWSAPTDAADAEPTELPVSVGSAWVPPHKQKKYDYAYDAYRVLRLSAMSSSYRLEDAWLPLSYVLPWCRYYDVRLNLETLEVKAEVLDAGFYSRVSSSCLSLASVSYGLDCVFQDPDSTVSVFGLFFPESMESVVVCATPAPSSPRSQSPVQTPAQTPVQSPAQTPVQTPVQPRSRSRSRSPPPAPMKPRRRRRRLRKIEEEGEEREEREEGEERPAKRTRVSSC